MVKNKKNKGLIIFVILILVTIVISEQGKKENSYSTPLKDACETELFDSHIPNGCYTECFFASATLVNTCNLNVGHTDRWTYYYDTDCDFSSSDQDRVDCLKMKNHNPYHNNRSICQYDPH